MAIGGKRSDLFTGPVALNGRALSFVGIDGLITYTDGLDPGTTYTLGIDYGPSNSDQFSLAGIALDTGGRILPQGRDASRPLTTQTSFVTRT